MGWEEAFKEYTGGFAYAHSEIEINAMRAGFEAGYKAAAPPEPIPVDMSKLTERQREVYTFIRETILSKRIPPTVREIAQQFDIRSPNGVACHLDALVKKGFIIKGDSGQSRAIMLTDQ